MKTSFSDMRLQDSIRTIEAILENKYDGLPDVSIEVVPNGKKVGTTSCGKAIEIKDEAGYWCRTIYLNSDKFFIQDKDCQIAILAHEFGHFLIETVPIKEFQNEEELRADWLVCSWGLMPGLEKVWSDRPEYLAVLKKWNNNEEFESASTMYLYEKRAGLVR